MRMCRFEDVECRVGLAQMVLATALCLMHILRCHPRPTVTTRLLPTLQKLSSVFVVRQIFASESSATPLARVLSLHLCGAGRCTAPPPSMITVMSAALMANSPPIYCDPNNPARCTCNGVPIGPDTWTAPSWLESNSDLRSCLKPTALYDVLPELTVCSRVCSQRLPYTRPAPLSVVCPLHCQNSRQRQRCWSTLRPHEGCRT